MFFTLRVIHHNEFQREYVFGELIENSLEDIYELVLQLFRENEKSEVYIYTVEYDNYLKVVRKSCLDFRPMYLN